MARFLDAREAYAESYSTYEGEVSASEIEVLKNFSQKNKPLVMEDFGAGQPYSDEEVNADLKYIKERQAAKGRREETEKAGIMETAGGAMFELYEWGGGNCYAVRTAKLDDERGVDTVLEWENDDEVVRLAVDFTVKENLTDKRLELQEGIERGTLSTVKYFQSEAEDFRGKIEKVPKVILSFSRPQLKEFIDLLSATFNKEKSQVIKKREAEKKVQDSPLQLVLLEQARNQLKEQALYAWANFFENLNRRSVKLNEEAIEDANSLYNSVSSALEGNESVDDIMAKVSEIFERESENKIAGCLTDNHFFKNVFEISINLNRALKQVETVLLKKKSSLPLDSQQRASSELASDDSVRPWSLPRPARPFFRHRDF